MNAEAAESDVRIKILSGNIQKVGMGLCFVWGNGWKKDEDDLEFEPGYPFFVDGMNVRVFVARK